MEEKLRTIRVYLEDRNGFTDGDFYIELNQGMLNEDDFYHAVLNYIMTNIQIEVL